MRDVEGKEEARREPMRPPPMMEQGAREMLVGRHSKTNKRRRLVII